LIWDVIIARALRVLILHDR